MTTLSTHASADSTSADSAPVLPPIVGEALVARAAAVRDEVAKAFIGQDDVLDQILIVLLAGGHVLIEGVPGGGLVKRGRGHSRFLSWRSLAMRSTKSLASPGRG